MVPPPSCVCAETDWAARLAGRQAALKCSRVSYGGVSSAAAELEAPAAAADLDVLGAHDPDARPSGERVWRM